MDFGSLGELDAVYATISQSIEPDYVSAKRAPCMLTALPLTVIVELDGMNVLAKENGQGSITTQQVLDYVNQANN